MKITIPMLALLLACGGGDSETHTDENTVGNEAPTTTEPAAVLVIAPFTMTDSGGQSVSMRADGQLSMDGEDRLGPVFSADGRVTMDGDHIATIAADGTLATSDGEVIAVIAEDGSTTIGPYSISFGADGSLVGGNPDGPGMTLEPADTPAKRLAMAVLVMMTMPGEVSEDASSAEVEAVE